jgi:hypothetical protein
MYGKMLYQKIPIKKNRAHIATDRFIEEIDLHDLVILKAKNMHSDHLRGVAFALLSRLSRTYGERVHLVCDELVSFFAQGNTKMFFDSVDFTNINFVFSYNKPSSVPSEILAISDSLRLYRINSPAELKVLKDFGVQTKKDLRKLENESCVCMIHDELFTEPV